MFTLWQSNLEVENAPFMAGLPVYLLKLVILNFQLSLRESNQKPEAPYS